MKTAVFSARNYDREFLAASNAGGRHELVFFEVQLQESTASLAAGFPAVCVFVNDRLDRNTLRILALGGTRFIACRSAGFNHVDIGVAKSLQIRVCRVPRYSPYAVAEHSLALILALNRKICRAQARIREGNFSLDGLMGFDLHGKTAGLIGTGEIGAVMAKILLGLGCRVLAHDPLPNRALEAQGVVYLSLSDLLSASDLVSLHCPLVPENRHMISGETLARMKPGALLINTSRGGLVDTPAAIEALKSGHLGGLGLDVYEEEANLFFEDRSGQAIQDDVFARLLTFSNVLVTGHQAFFTREALTAIAGTTLKNLDDFQEGISTPNEIGVS